MTPRSPSTRSQAGEVPRLRAVLLADSLAGPAGDRDGAVRRGGCSPGWQPSWLRYSPLSFTGLAMIAAAFGLVYQAGYGAALQGSGLVRSGLDAAERVGVAASVAVGVLVGAGRVGGAVGAEIADDVRKPGAAP